MFTPPQKKTCHVSCVTCHVSCVLCHMSHVTCIFFSLTKWWSLLVEGLLSTGPTPSSLTRNRLSTTKKTTEQSQKKTFLKCINIKRTRRLTYKTLYTWKPPTHPFFGCMLVCTDVNIFFSLLFSTNMNASISTFAYIKINNHRKQNCNIFIMHLLNIKIMNNKCYFYV